MVPELYALCRYMSAGSRRMIGNSQTDEVMEDKDEKSKAEEVIEEEKVVKNKASSKADESHANGLLYHFDGVLSLYKEKFKDYMVD